MTGDVILEELDDLIRMTTNLIHASGKTLFMGSITSERNNLDDSIRSIHSLNGYRLPEEVPLPSKSALTFGNK